MVEHGPDLSILISTIISATAALVAIIGGFLISRVITLSSEQNSMKRRLREMTNELIQSTKLLNTSNANIMDDSVNTFIRHNLNSLIDPGFDLDKILRTYSIPGLSRDIVEPYLYSFNEIKSEINELLGKTKKYPIDFTEFLEENRFELINPKMRYLYEITYLALLRKLRPDDIFLSLKATELFKAATDDNTYNELIRVRDQYDLQTKMLSSQVNEQKKIFDEFGAPNGIWGGLIVLVYACIVGIGYPTTLLPYELDTYDDFLTKWVLIALFVSELIALFVYLGINIYKLTHNMNLYK